MKKKKPAPAPKPKVIICSGSELALVLGKCQRMGYMAGTPVKTGIDRYEIVLGTAVDTFDRKASGAEEIWTFAQPRHPNNI